MNQKADMMILGDGEKCTYSSDSKLTGINNNVLVIGGSGSGKTVSIIEPRFLTTFSKSLIVTVTKRRIVEKYTFLMKERGYHILDLNFVHPLQGNVGFDPLQHIASFVDITFLARSIVLANPQKAIPNAADPYFDETAVSLLCSEIAYIMMTKDNPSFGDVLDFHNNLKFEDSGGVITTNYDYEFECLEEQDPSCFAVTCWKSFKNLPIKTGSCVFSSLNTTMDSIFTPELRVMFQMKQTVDFEELASRKTVLFVTSSPVNSSLHCFISMFYGYAFKELFEFAEGQPNGELPVYVDVLADDFATGCPINMFEQYISIFREKGLSVTLLIQSESQLSSLYGKDKATTIINNCDSICYLGSMDIDTGKNISLRSNKPLEDILYMPVGEEIIFRRGQKPVFTKRYNITENKLYQKISAAYEKRIGAEMEDRLK